MSKRSVFRFLLLDYLAENAHLTGYQFIKYCHDIGIPASSGSVYPHLRDLEQEGIIAMHQCGRRKVYEFTATGRQLMDRLEQDVVVPHSLKHLFFRMSYHVQKTGLREPAHIDGLIELVDTARHELLQIRDRMRGTSGRAAQCAIQS